MKNKRLFYLLAAILLFGIEVCIALFVHDSFVRPYVGDVLVVILVHCALRVVWPERPKLLALYVFLFACCVEFSQALHILQLLGLRNIRFLRILIGTSFSWADILCYAAGCLMAGLGELGYDHRKR